MVDQISLFFFPIGKQMQKLEDPLCANLGDVPTTKQFLSPAKYAQMLATRPELELSADWMFVPSARNLSWRYQVLHNAFTVVKIRTSKDTDHYQYLVKMLEAMKLVWKESKVTRL